MIVVVIVVIGGVLAEDLEALYLELVSLGRGAWM